MVTIGIIGAFLAGVLTLISPCSALLLPAFFAYAFSSARQLLARTAVFYLGLCATLVPIGTGVAAVFATHRDAVIAVAGWVLIVLGVFTALGGGFQLPGLSTMSSRVRGSGALAVFALGAVYGFAGFCAGPLLGAVLTTAGASGSGAYGALIMASYALGMAAPLFLLALLWDKWNVADKAWLRARPITLGPITTSTYALIAGGLFALIGALFILSHGTAALPTALSTDAQFRIQEHVQRLSSGITDAWAWFGLSLLATIAVAVKAAQTPSPS